MRIYPGVIYGPGSLTEGNLVGRLVRDYVSNRLPGLIGPEHVWSYSYATDVAAGVCAAIERGRAGARYALGGENAPQSRVFEIVAPLTGRRPPRRIPFPIGTAMGAFEEMRARVFGATPLVTRGAVEILRHDWPLDSSDAIRELAYRITPLSEGVRQMLDSITNGISASEHPRA
jgi:farnesol dehydrogenase